MDRELARTPKPRGVMVLISDGGGNVTLGSSDPMREALEIARGISTKGIDSIVLDSAPRGEGSPLAGRPTAARRISEALEASYYPVRNLSSETILDRVGRTGPVEATTARRQS
jgi:Mg-chelatase subunit ChlD